MASGKDAKARRQAQNRAQRERLAARREAAQSKGAPAAGASAAPKSRWQKLLAPPAGAAGAKASAGTARPARPVRPGPAFLRRFGYEQPGGRAVHLAVPLTIAAALFALLWNGTVGLNKAGDIAKKGQKVVTKMSLLEYKGATALLLVGLPVLVVLVSILLARPATRKRTWGIGALALWLFIILDGGIGFFFFVPAACMGYGWWQAGKEEREARMVQAQKAREARRKGGGPAGRSRGAASGPGSRSRGAPAAPAGPLGGLFKRRDVVDTTAAEVTEDVDDENAELDEGYDDQGFDEDGYEEAEATDDATTLAAERRQPAGAGGGKRPKPSKADVAAAIAAGRRGRRRPPQR